VWGGGVGVGGWGGGGGGRRANIAYTDFYVTTSILPGKSNDDTVGVARQDAGSMHHCIIYHATLQTLILFLQ